MADALDATLICQIYSRLVIDCNRDHSVPSSICEISEVTAVPGNVGLSAEERHARQSEIMAPYHERIMLELDRRSAQRAPTVLVAMHSFTPVFKDFVAALACRRALQSRSALRPHLLDLLRREGDLTVGDNEPY